MGATAEMTIEQRFTRPGNPITLGSLIGDVDGNRMARIVGIRKDAYPMGEYRTSWLIMPCTRWELSSVCVKRRRAEAGAA